MKLETKPLDMRVMFIDSTGLAHIMGAMPPEELELDSEIEFMWDDGKPVTARLIKVNPRMALYREKIN